MMKTSTNLDVCSNLIGEHGDKIMNIYIYIYIVLKNVDIIYVWMLDNIYIYIYTLT